MRVDRETAISWFEGVTVRYDNFFLHQDDPTVDLEALCRALARDLVYSIEAASMTHGYAIEAELQRCVSKGLTLGALDAMFHCDPNPLRKEYADRKRVELN